ncbi:interleukin-6 receptor subunit beta-like isoform X2 [Sander lucioperca]|uniref:interleukin-6 receptor subunit beta-like isoform X2 n=1 Tax=Sander lucioperca TaxID=283035 RepID=UPI0016539E2D|nr:interleukin-6 receptor subunit beta-like isoform X2 [Sander lucioperca]
MRCSVGDSRHYQTEMYFFLVILMLGVIPSICKGQHENTCNVVPKDIYIEVRSDIDVVCQTSCVHDKIFWTLNNRPVDKSLSNTINSSHTVLSLRNFTHQSATLLCRSENTQQVLGGTTIKTYSKPSKISCFLHGTDQTTEGSPDQITCKWEHHFNPSKKINYILNASSSVLTNQPTFEICKSSSTNCTNIINLKLFDHNITVRAKIDDYLEVDSDPYTFHPNDILKMIPPQLKVTPVSDDLLVEWRRARLSQKCHCQVKYSKAVNERTSELVLNETLNGNEHGKVTIEKVESCSNYTFSVRCALDKAPWSDWSQKIVLTTKLNKRDVKLRLWRKIAELEKNGVRKVHAMWTEIPSTCQDTFTYTIKQTPYKEHMMGVNYTDTLCGKSTCDVNQDAHRIHLTVQNKAPLEFMDSVYVPAIGESLPQVTDIQTSTLEGVILVSWKAPIQPVSGYMIDWTHNGNQYQWKESNDTNTTLSNLLDKTPYNITVTPLFDDKTGHGTQALQICSRVAAPGNVTIRVKANDKSALVSWDVKSQEACSGAAVNYTVFYRTQDGGPQLNVTVNGTECHLKDLNPDTQYSVYVKATALTGTTKSSENSFKTKRFGPGIITAVSVCGSIIILLVLSLGLSCAVQWKKFREKPVPNPGNSSVALWPASSRQEGMCPFQPFSNPTESLCDKVYTEETLRMSISPLVTSCNGNLMSDQTDEYVDPGTVPAPDEQNEDLVNHAETQHLSSPDDSTALLPSETSPYRSQTFVESPVSKPNNHCKRLPVKQPEKTALVTVYVTLDMFEQGQGR